LHQPSPNPPLLKYVAWMGGVPASPQPLTCPNLPPTLHFYAMQRANMAAMELEELKPSLRRLSVGGSGSDMSDAASEIERIAKRCV